MAGCIRMQPAARSNASYVADTGQGRDPAASPMEFFRAARSRPVRRHYPLTSNPRISFALITASAISSVVMRLVIARLRMRL
jgi:hypothetical protein